MTKKLLLVLLLSSSFSSQAQNKILFHVQYKPQMTYDQTVEQGFVTNMTYSGSKEFIQKLKEKGIQNPTIKTTESTTKMVVKTGTLADSKLFPLTMDFVETISSDGKKPIPDGTLIYGHCIADKVPTLDSISSKDMDEELKRLMLPVLQSTFSQLTFPKKEVKVGESFTDKTPLSIPIGGITLDMEITTIYKLISIQNGTANFDVTQVYTMKTDVADFKIKATGAGKGKMVYDIANNYYLYYELENTMDMTTKADQFDLDLHLTNKNIQKITISQNK